MVGRYTFETELSRFISRFELGTWGAYVQSRYNIAPGEVMPVITRHSPNKAQWMQWGLVTSWVKHPMLGGAMVNVSVEKVLKQSTLRRLLLTRRCLVPASGFYLWERTKSSKQPYYVRVNGRSLFAFAGIYDVWRDGDGNELKSYTIITTAANALLSSFEDSMPVILREEDEDTWLDPTMHDIEVLRSLLQPYDDDQMTLYPVSPTINEASGDGPDLISPIPR